MALDGRRALAAALAPSTTSRCRELGLFALVDFLVWASGLGMEATAGIQKSRFRADPGNKGRFIHTGLWARTRHSDCFGEIVLQIGVAIIALPAVEAYSLKEDTISDLTLSSCLKGL